MADTHDPIQELVKKARRNQILDAATKVFAEKGFHPTTIKDIATVAGIADGNQPFDRFLADILRCIPFMVNLSCAGMAQRRTSLPRCCWCQCSHLLF